MTAARWVAVIATSVQQLAAFLGTPEAELNQGHYLFLGIVALMVIPLNAGAISFYCLPDMPWWVTTATAGAFLAWHGYALVLLSGAVGLRNMEFFVHVLSDKTFSTVYQAVQTGAFAFVVVATSWRALRVRS